MIAHQRARVSAVAAIVLVTSAGGALDAWVYIAHGHVFANAQTGNVVLMMIATSTGDVQQAANHLPSLIAFIAGVFVSRQAGSLLHRSALDARGIRLGCEGLLLTALAFAAAHLSDRSITACVGFIAGLQITSLSHIGGWSFNTGMTTGNLRGAVSALSKVLTGAPEERAHALVIGALCVAFAIGALMGAWLTPRLGNLTLLPVAALVAAALAAAPRGLDPIPDWKNLR